MSFDQAIQVIERGGGKVEGENITIVCQQPVPVRYEKAFEGLYPTEIKELRKKVTEVGEFVFEGTGVVFKGNVTSKNGRGARGEVSDYVASVVISIDGEKVETVNLPASYRIRRNEIFWKYQLANTSHTVTFEWLNPTDEYSVNVNNVIVYSDKPSVNKHQQ
jgi:hypothetical protein